MLYTNNCYAFLGIVSSPSLGQYLAFAGTVGYISKFVTHDRCYRDLVVIFFAAEHRRSLARTKLYCLVAEARCPESLHDNINNNNNNNTYDRQYDLFPE